MGSGLTNLVCSKETVSVLGIVANVRLEDTHKFILENLGAKYFEYIEYDEKNFIYHNRHNKNNDFDFYLDIDKFKIVFNEFENTK